MDQARYQELMMREAGQLLDKIHLSGTVKQEHTVGQEFVDALREGIERANAKTLLPSTTFCPHYHRELDPAGSGSALGVTVEVVNQVTAQLLHLRLGPLAHLTHLLPETRNVVLGRHRGPEIERRADHGEHQRHERVHRLAESKPRFELAADQEVSHEPDCIPPAAKT